MLSLRASVSAFFARNDGRIMLIATWMLILGFGFTRAFYLSEGDIFWEIRAGQDTLTTGMIPRLADWAWLIQGREWLPNSWLWNVVLALVYNLGGFTAIGWLNLVFFVGIFALVWLLLKQLGASKVACFNLLVLTFAASLIWLTVRPQEADYLLLLAFLNLVVWVLRTRPQRVVRWLPLGAVLAAALWQNFHLTGTVAVILFPAGFWFLATFLKTHTWRQRILPASLIGLGALLGTLATPFGLEAIAKSGTVLEASRGILLEWSPIDFAFPFDVLAFVAVLIFGVLPLVLALRRRQWLYALFLLVFVVASFEIVRFSQFLIFFNLIAFALWSGDGGAAARTKRRGPLGSAYLGLGLAVIALGLFIAGPRLADPDGLLLTSSQDLAVIPSSTRVLTTGGGGSQIILTRPDLSPSLDSRNDIYGRKDFLYLNHLLYWDRSAPVADFIQREHVGAVYVPHTPEAAKLTIVRNMREIGWREVRQADSIIFLPR